MRGCLKHRKIKTLTLYPHQTKKQIKLAGLVHEFATELQLRAKIANENDENNENLMRGVKTDAGGDGKLKFSFPWPKEY